MENEIIICQNCNKEFKFKKGKKFCSKRCKDRYNSRKNSKKRYSIRKNNPDYMIKNRKKCNIWYEKNKDYQISKSLENLKNNNYYSQKTPIQRIIRSIKRKTRYYFKLEGHNCEFCGNKATEHHHNTNPIEFDKFNYICHPCHIIKNREMRLK